MNEPLTLNRVCVRCESPLEKGDLRCAICGQSAPHEKESGAQEVAVKILRCTGCGAAIGYDPKHQAPSCSFCGDVVKVESVKDPMEQTEHYLPFTVSEDQARTALRRWLGSQSWFCPSDLSSGARLTELKPLWWVAWVFDADAFVSWAADSDAGAGRSAWAPHSGQGPLRFDGILVSASRGLSDREANAITPGMDLSSKRDSPQGADDNATVEQFDVQRSQARQAVSAAIHRLAADQIQKRFIPGSTFRNVKVSIVLRGLITHRLALPAYVLAYRYKDQLYRVVICGQDQRLVIGKAPTSLLKVIAVIGAAILALLFFFGFLSLFS